MSRRSRERLLAWCQMQLAARWRRLVGWGAVAAVVGIAVAGVLAYTVPLPERLEARDSRVVEWRDGRAAHVLLSADDRWRIPVDRSRVDDDYVEALVALEDSQFWWHPGVDPVAILRAAYTNAVSGRVVSGASTITMQLVRVLEPRPRTLTSKAVEALRAVQLEMRMSKREILEAYLSYVPYGRNIEGIASASHLYFDKPPERLSGDEIAALLAVPQDPNARYPSSDNRERLEAARDRIAGRLVAAGALPRGEGNAEVDGEALMEQIRRSPVPATLGSMPRELPHAARWLRANTPGTGRIRSTIDRETQQTVERLVDARRSRLHGQGIYNASAVVVEHETGAVRALIGNVDFDDRQHGGQIAGFARARSTGSLLKPFIYASAIEEGAAAPSHVVVDVPRSFGGYRPRNFGGTYHGLVGLEEALSQSLNIPFVELLGRVGLDPFLTRLRRLGVEEFTRPADEYGLSVAVGGMEMTPLEVASLYGTLARDGRLIDVHARRTDGGGGEGADRELSVGASWLTRRALRKRDRPDFPVRKQASEVPTGIHWKTGTSARNRDAWSAGSGPRYTAVVWVGNFDNSRSPALVGSRTAGPMFFDIIEALERRDEAGPSERPASLIDVEVCAFSGHRPADACPRTKQVPMPETSVATATCPYHVEREIDPATGRAVAPGCRSDVRTIERSFLKVPARAARWMNDRIGSLPAPPPYKQGCRARSGGTGPAVEHPPPNRSLVLVPGMPRSDQQVPLEANAATQGATLHWFVDGEFLGSADSDDRFWWTPEPGRHDIVVMDEAGRSDRRRLVVREGR